ncbi:MAG TPA: hypothetical protein VK922_00905 [Gemmatimonadaceae bacterium]|nr:hypothetical protein [Gemmatimonadaceae bacterium]
MDSRHSTWREGLIAGAIGATVVAVWFFVVDIIAGHPLYTPTILGQAVFSVLGSTAGDPQLLHVAVYTVFHYVVFMLFGVLTMTIVHRSERQPSILALLLIAFVVLEMGFYGYTAILSAAGVLPGELAWYQVAVGNLLAAVAMGTYMYKLHPAIGRNFNRALADEPRGS